MQPPINPRADRPPEKRTTSKPEVRLNKWLALLLIVATGAISWWYWLNTTAPDRAYTEAMRQLFVAIHDGDDRRAVERRLGPAARTGTSSPIEHILTTDSVRYPAGVQPTDRFVCYRYGLSDGSTREVCLQFRDNKLVNHVPGDFRNRGENALQKD